MTAVLHVQWSEVWGLPWWLWRAYVAQVEAYIAAQKEASRV